MTTVSRWTGHEARALRVALRLSVRSFAERLGIAARTISKWEKVGRGTTPWPDTQAMLDTVLAQASDEARSRFVQLLDSSAQQQVSYSPPAVAVASAVAEESVWPLGIEQVQAAAVALWSDQRADPPEVDPTLRTVSHSVIFRWLVARRDNPNSPTVRAGTRHVTRDDVAALQAMKRSLAALDDEHGGGVALPMTLKYLDIEVLPLLHAHYTERTRRALFGAAAELAMLAGWMAYDAGQHGHARRQMLHALRVSHFADDRLFGGRVLVAMSHQALHLGQLQDGIDFAAAATRGARAVGVPAAVALFAASQARALAAHGDKSASFQLMRTAEQALARAAAADAPEWLAFMDDAELAGKFGRCFRDLGLHEEAQRHLDTSLALHKPQYQRSRAITKIIQASSHARQGELEPACQLGLEALPEVGRLRSQRTREYLTDLYHSLGAYDGEPLVRSFRERARHLVANQPA